MTPLSPRFLLPLAVLTALTVVPVWVHSRGGRDFEDCADAEALRQRSAYHNRTVEPEFVTLESPKWWSAGGVRVGGPRTPLLRFAVLRAHRPNSIYLQPHYFLDVTFEPESARIEWLDLPDGTRLPVHFVQDTSGSGVKLAGYLIVYRGEPVARPFAAQLRAALPLLLEGTPPMNLFLVGGAVPRFLQRRAEERIRSWLTDAWAHYDRVCHPANANAEPAR